MSIPLEYEPASASGLVEDLELQSVSTLAQLEHQGLALGELCLPSLRWALRLHDVPDEPGSRLLFANYLRSAASLAEKMDRIFEAQRPPALVLFNGITYPEAVARAVAARRGVPVVTHEVGLRPMSAFFTHQEATFRQVDIEPGEALSAADAERLDGYLQARRRGDFSMAGVRFWDRMGGIPGQLERVAKAHQRVCAVFTNVIFDTSQVHANTLFPDMFAWLDWLAAVMREQSETLFVIRAHPDEHRPGKSARQSVAEWFKASGIGELDNVIFVPSDSPISSYELAQWADLALIYNSSIGLEAAADGIPVLAAGRARFSDAGVVIQPGRLDEYARDLGRWLAGERLTPPDGFESRARQFLHRELYSASLGFSDFIQAHPSMAGMVQLLDFPPDLLKEHETLRVLSSGILDGDRFEMSGSQPVETI